MLRPRLGKSLWPYLNGRTCVMASPSSLSCRALWGRHPNNLAAYDDEDRLGIGCLIIEFKARKSHG